MSNLTNPYVSKLRLIHSGKVRETYETTNHNYLLIVATDRISTHNKIHLSLVPRKGHVLTALSIFWFLEVLESINIPHHLVAYGLGIYEYLPGNPSDYPADLHLRSIIVRKLKMVPVEFIFRAYLCGSLWDKFYSKSKADPYGLDLPTGLSLMSKLDPFAFTPTDKSETDEPLKTNDVTSNYANESELCKRVFAAVQEYLTHGEVEVLDTKLEVGCDNEGRLRLGDEVLTPDSSRFTYRNNIVLGHNPPWLDKQLVRDYVEKKCEGGKISPLVLPEEVISATINRYEQVTELVTLRTLEEFQKELMF